MKKLTRKTKALTSKYQTKPQASERAAVNRLLSDLRTMIERSRMQVAQTVNSGMVTLYWNVGRRIRNEVLKGKRAEYGAEILPTVSAKLAPEYGQGFSQRNLARMIRFADVFPDSKIVSDLSDTVGWSHFVEILPLKDRLQREFYAGLCMKERWTVRQLRQKIAGMLYERTALSKKPAQLIERELKALREEGRLTPDMVFRDPYFLDSLGLKDEFSEKDLEAAIIRDLESFILELGIGFTFMARQKRIIVDGRDYYLDLLFYHRILHRLVAIELKLESFQAAHKGQMELYLRWLDKYERQAGEESPIGLILCTGKSDEHIELLELDKSGIRVAEYLTELPPPKLLRKMLRESVALARERLARKGSIARE